jgi:hypothetical protein
MKRVLIAVVISIICGMIPNMIESNSLAWRLYTVFKHVELFTWLLVLTSFIPYKQLATKSVMAVLVVTELFDILIYSFWFLSLNLYLIFFIKTVSCISAFIWMYWRDYNKGNDILDNDHFFMVGIRPNSLQDFILSLVKDPVGGVGIYVKGELYHYRHGSLQVNNDAFISKYKSKYRIKKIREIDERRLFTLKYIINSNKYTKWTWFYNCKTVLEPILGKRGKPYFLSKREFKKGIKLNG